MNRDEQRAWLLREIEQDAEAYRHWRDKMGPGDVTASVHYGRVDAFIRTGWHFDLFDREMAGDLANILIGLDIRLPPELGVDDEP